LLSVLLGVLFLREKLRRGSGSRSGWQPSCHLCGHLVRPVPWIALTLAFSFGLYGLVKKMAPLGSLYGLTLETGCFSCQRLCSWALWKAGGVSACHFRLQTC